MSRHLIMLSKATLAKAIAGVQIAAKRGWAMELREPTRSDEQNDALHGLITQILKQRPHHCGMRMSKESYKAIFMHALGIETPMLPTLAGDGFFPMGLRTSKLTVGEFSQLIESILAWCAKEGLTIAHFDDAALSPGRTVAQEEQKLLPPPGTGAAIKQAVPEVVE